MSEDLFSPIDRFFSAVDLIANQLGFRQSDIASYIRKYDSLMTLESVIIGKRLENPTKADEYIETIENLKGKIITETMDILGFTIVDEKRVFPLFIRILQSMNLEEKKANNLS